MFNAFTQHEKAFADWRRAGCPGATAKTLVFLEHLGQDTTERKLWPHQREAFLRVVYAYEVLERPNLLLNVVTGGGKTPVIAATMAWLRLAYDVRSVVVLTPNQIVRDRLRDDFGAGRFFTEFGFFPPVSSYLIDDLGLFVLGD